MGIPAGYLNEKRLLFKLSSQGLYALQQYGRAEWNRATHDVQTLSAAETETLVLFCSPDV